MALKGFLGRLLYGALFVALLPALLVLWARALDAGWDNPRIHLPLHGVVFAALGAVTLFSGFWGIRVHGGGLPMNAFPPPHYVTRGIYALLSHPIYVGFSCLVFGVSLYFGSPGGVYLVTPTIALGSAALVFGYERHDLVRRFGKLAKPRVWLPPDEPSPPRLGDRAFVWLMVIAPWAVGYDAVARLGVPPDAVSTACALDRAIPVMPWTEAIYASIYPMVLALPLLAKTRADLRRASSRALLAMALVFPLWLALPLVAPPRAFEPGDALGRLLALERAFDTAACAFPSFHVIWALCVADALASRSRLGYVWAVALAFSCLTTGMHTLADVLAGLGVWGLVRRAEGVWELARRSAERVANSWREWRFGPLRVINHGVWAALGTFAALGIVGAFLGPRAPLPLGVIWLSTLLGAALWAQWIEGASGLSRPYGFWGGLLGATLGGLLARAFGVDPWLALGALAVSAPFIQSLGRLRCLVQGCCHGSRANAKVGIVYRHPRSRVAKVVELFEQPLHPTQLYSVLWNVPVALATLRLASLHARASLVVGVYLILTGAGRFVEESYRGEPQTPVMAGLRAYQWLGIAAIVAGASLSALRSTSMPVPSLGWASLGVAALGALLNFAAFGVDFPDSERRFSRLA